MPLLIVLVVVVIAVTLTVTALLRHGRGRIPTDYSRLPDEYRVPVQFFRRGLRLIFVVPSWSQAVRLLIGLPLYGVGCALTVEAGLGVDPWTVLAQGLAIRTGIGVGWMANILGALVLLAWIPLRQRPGLGTVLNVLLVGTGMQFALDVLPAPSGLASRIGLLLLGILVVAVASGVYIGARMGPGPRDGLMTGMNARLGWPVWRSRLVVELSVLAIGWLLGGTVGVGTLVFAAAIGPAVHLALRLLAPRPRRARSAVASSPSDASSPMPSVQQNPDHSPAARRVVE